MKNKRTFFKKISLALVMSIIMLLAIKGYAQPFGTDVMVNNYLYGEQTQPKITIAYNGLMFASYCMDNNSTFIMKSTNNGLNWSQLVIFSDVALSDIIVCGNSASNLNLFIANFNKLTKKLELYKYNVSGGTFTAPYTSSLYGNSITDLKLATDYTFPSSGASPYSVALAYSIRTSIYDSLICITSPNGGNTFPLSNKRVVDVTSTYFNKVSVCFGRSKSQTSGSYFVAYEEFSNSSTLFGRIKFAKSNNGFNDIFTTPKYLDNIFASDYNLCRNPVVSCQTDNVDNSIKGLTAIVASDRKYSETDIDVIFFSTLDPKKASVIWNRYNMSSIDGLETQADMVYDPINHNFLVTYYNQSLQKLPYISQDLNLTNPYFWTIISNAYNDSPNLSDPCPQIEFNPLYNKAAFLWSRFGDYPILYSKVMFDAEYRKIVSKTGIAENIVTSKELLVYPNPASNIANIDFELNNAGLVQLNVYDITGKKVNNLYHAQTPEGKNTISIDVSNYANGNYIIEMLTPELRTTKSLVVAHQ